MTLTLTWTDADGVDTVLTDANGFRVLKGAQGFDAPAPTNTVEDFTAFDGAALAARRYGPKQVLLPLYVTHPTRVQTRIAQLAEMVQGPGMLTWSDGTNLRYLRNVVYEAGLGGDLGVEASRPDEGMVKGWRKVTLSLLALDPWWYGPAVSVSLPVATPTAFDAAIGFDAVVPFDGGATVTVLVAGSKGGDAYPVVTVYGPATSVVVGSGGEEWQTASALLTGDVLVVDSRPGFRGPRLNGGNVDWSLLTAASRLWLLAPGSRSVVVGTTGSSGSTVISLQYSPRFRTP